jgi:hydroxyacyl-ACP dehydratase HTD2-like protein with hotdog domain
MNIGVMNIGDRLPDLVRTITLTDMVAYGGATWDFHRLHYDQGYAAHAGMERPVIDGQMFGALLAEQVTRSLEPGQWISRLFFRNTAPAYADETVVCEAEVTATNSVLTIVQLRVRVGDRLVVAAAGAELSRS